MIPNKCHSDYWMGDLFDRYFTNQPATSTPTSPFADAFNLIRLSIFKRVISNFVCIISDKNVPVFFNDEDMGRSFTDAKNAVVISSKINSKEDLDVSVGLALHEGCHLVKTDASLMIRLFAKMTDDLKRPALEKGLSLAQIETFTRRVWNFIEDRFIDDWAWKNAPGYRMYYWSLYNRYFFHPQISEALKSKLLRVPTLRAYRYRIFNMMNPDADLDALPALRDIAKIIDLSNISRLKLPEDRMDLAFNVASKVFENMSTEEPEEDKKTDVYEQFFGQGCPSGLSAGDGEGDGNTDDNQEDPTDENTESEENDDEPENTTENDSGEAANETTGSGGSSDQNEESDKEPESAAPGPEKEKERNENLVNGWGDTSEFSSREIGKIEDAFQDQDNFIRGIIDKDAITSAQKQLLSMIDSLGIELRPVGAGMAGNLGKPPVDCVVVKKMTRELIFSDLFPMRHGNKVIGENWEPDPDIAEAVIEGIRLGKKLGKKLLVRNEINSLKFPHQRCGKIDRRALAGIACGLEDIFCKIKVDKFNHLTLHISVDASMSMATGKKWVETMTMVVALCKATSVVGNIRTVISFRTTCNPDGNVYGGMCLPYVVLAYDSRVDKFSKVKELFPFLGPNGCTPEGLAFEAISDLFDKKSLEDFYFINISDGEPCFEMSYKAFNRTIKVVYMDDVGSEHTRAEVNKIRKYGVKVLSYFIKTEYDSGVDENLKRQFRIMYGRDAQFIDVNDVKQIARTMNNKFIDRT